MPWCSGAATAALVLSTVLLTLRAWRRFCPAGPCWATLPHTTPQHARTRSVRLSCCQQGSSLLPDLPPTGKTTAL